MDRIFVALRYLLARPIALITMAAVLVGVGSLIVVDSVMNGFLHEQCMLIRGTTADLSVRIPVGMRGSPEAIERLLAQAGQTRDVSAVSLRLSWPALWRDEEGRLPTTGMSDFGAYHFIQLVGVDPVEERRVSRFFEASEGPAAEAGPQADLFAYDPSDPFWAERIPERMWRWPLVPLLVGRKLATIMELEVGTVLSLATFGDQEDQRGALNARSKQCVISALFDTGDAEFDLTRALIRRSDLVRFVGTESLADEIVCRVSAAAALDPVRESLRSALLPLGVGVEAVATWMDLKAVLLGAVENERRALAIVLFFVVVVASFNLVVTLCMMVNEKARDIGILVSLGSTPAQVAVLFLLCGMIVTAAGLVLGFGGGLLLTIYLNELHDAVRSLTGWQPFDPSVFLFTELPTRIDYARIAWFVAGTVVCSLLFTLYPAWRAARLDAVDSLRRG